MSDMDSQHEQQRLTTLYSQMTEGELEKIAAEASTLTDLARGILITEFEKRGMAMIPETFAGRHEVEFQDLVTIRQFRDLPEAILARGVLESAGIDSFLADENIVRMDWFISNLVGGIKLRVKREDLEAALAVLAEPASGDFRSEEENS